MKTICSNCEAENDSNSKYCANCGYTLANNESENITPEIKEAPSKPEKKFNIKTLLGFVVGFVIMFFVTQSLFKPSIDKQLTETANEINKSCPMRVDQYTTLKNAVALPGKTIQYNYILEGITKAEIKLDTVKKYVFQGVLENVKSNPQMKSFRDNKVTLNYHYTDKNGDFITEYIVKPEMYE